MAELSLDEYLAYIKNNGEPVSSEVDSMPGEAVPRLSSTPVIDRDVLKTEGVRYKNAAFFLGDALTTDSYKERMKKYDSAAGIYAKPELGILDNLGEKMRNIGQLWFEKTETYKRETEKQDGEEYPTDNSLMTNIGFTAPKTETVPVDTTGFSAKVSEMFKVSEPTAKQGLNTFLNYKRDETVTFVADMVRDLVPVNMAARNTETTITLFGDQDYDEVSVHNVISDNVITTALGTLIAGDTGTPVAMQGLTVIAGLIQRVSGVDRDSALNITDNLIASTADILTSNAAELGGFTPEDFNRVASTYDPRKIIPEGAGDTDPYEVYQSGITYWSARVGAAIEQTILNKANTYVTAEELKRDMLGNITNPVVRNSVSNIVDSFTMSRTPLSYMDATTLQTLKTYTDPTTSPLAILTPSVMQTREYRALEARRQGLGAQVFNTVTETAFDFLVLITELVIAKKLISMTPAAGIVAPAKGLTASQLARLSRVTEGGLTELTFNKVIMNGQISAYLRNAAFMGVYRAISTPGEWSDKAIAGTVTAVYASTPLTTGIALRGLGYTAPGAVLPFLIDAASNSLLTTGMSYAPAYFAEGGFTPEFWANAIPQVVFDIGMAASTRGLATSKIFAERVQSHDKRVYTELKQNNNGESPINLVTGKPVTETEYVDLKGKQRAKLESVQKILDAYYDRLEKKAMGERRIPGTPETEVRLSKGYKDSVISKYNKLIMKEAFKLPKLYAELYKIIDTLAAGEDSGLTAKQIYALKSRRTRIENQISVIRGTDLPEDTEKPVVKPKDLPESTRDKFALDRIKRVTEELKTVIAEEKQVNDQISKRAYQPNKQLETKQSELLDKISGLKTEQYGLMYYNRDSSQLTPGQLDSLKLFMMTEQLNKFDEGYTAGKQAAVSDIQDFQKYFTATIKTAVFLTPKQRESLLYKTTRIYKEKEFNKQLAETRLVIQELEQSNAKQMYLEACDRLLDRVKKGIQSKKFDADTTAAFKAAILEKSIDVIRMDDPGARFENNALSRLQYDMRVLNDPQSTPKQVEAVYRDLVNVYDLGAASKTCARAADKTRADHLVSCAIADISGDRGFAGSTLTPEERAVYRKGAPVGAIMAFLRGHRNWSGLITDLTQRLKTRPGESITEIFTDMFPAERVSSALKNKFIQAKLELYARVYGAKNRHDVSDRTTKDLQETVDINIGETGNKTVNINRTVARQRYMEWNQTEGRQRLTKKHLYTENTMKQITEFLTAEDLKIIHGERQIYDDLYGMVNPIFRELSGYDLPYRENYSPFIPDGESRTASVIDLLHADFDRSPAIDSKRPLKEMKGSSALSAEGDTFLIDRYIQDMTQYSGFAKTIKDVNTVFGDSRVRDLILQKYGENMLTVIDKQIDVLTTGKIQTELNGVFSGLTRTISRWARAQIVPQPKRFALQLVSTVLYGSEIPVKDLITGLIDVPRAIATGEIEVVTKNQYLTDRGIDPGRDSLLLKDAVDRQKNPVMRSLLDNPRLEDIASVFLRAGDKGAIIGGTWALYRYYTKNLKIVPEIALEKAIRFSNGTQQSSDLSQLGTVLMDSNPIYRVFTLFKSTPAQFFNRYLDALVNRGRISTTELAKTLAAYHVLAAVYVTVSNAGKIGLGALATTAITGPLADGIIFLGDFLPRIVGYVITQSLDESTAYVPRENFIDGTLTKLLRTIKTVGEILDYGVDAENVIRLARQLGDTSTIIGGTPSAILRSVADVAEGARSYFEDDDFERMLLKIAGYTDYQLKEK